MAAIEKKPGMDRLHRALVEAQRLTETGVEMMRQDGREIGKMAKSEFRDLAGQARLSAGRECVRARNRAGEARPRSAGPWREHGEAFAATRARLTDGQTARGSARFDSTRICCSSLP